MSITSCCPRRVLAILLASSPALCLLLLALQQGKGRELVNMVFASIVSLTFFFSP